LLPAALAFALALSFTAVGIFVGAIGFALEIDDGIFRSAGAMPVTRLALIWRSYDPVGFDYCIMQGLVDTRLISAERSATFLMRP